MVPVEVVAALARPSIRAKDRLAVAVLHPVDQRRGDALAVLVEHRIGRGQPQWRCLTGAERHRIHPRHVVHDAEFLDRLADRLHPDRRGDMRGRQVARMFERHPQRDWSHEGVLVVARRPRRQTRTLAERDRIVVHQGRWREPVFERGQVDERLDRRSRLALGLRRAVELAQLEAEPASHRQNAAGVRIEHDEGA